MTMGLAFPSPRNGAGAAGSGDALEFPETLTATLISVDSTTRREGNSIMLIATCDDTGVEIRFLGISAKVVVRRIELCSSEILVFVEGTK
jgi:hypothetical protein